MSRDDFSPKIKETLAKRAGYLCSNPNCKQLTVGSNEDPGKSTSIGIAAHITAASEGGPRFDESLSPEQRVDIYNGIWLCSNCATLIDKDVRKYSIELIRQWKQLAEIESAARLLGKKLVNIRDVPYIEADLVYTSGARLTHGYSRKNPLKTDKEGNFYYDVSEKPIIHWELVWRYKFVLYNHSNLPAINIRLDSIGDMFFNKIQNLPKVNNLPPLSHLELETSFNYFFEGTGIEADRILKPRIPNIFADMQIRIAYYDTAGDQYFTLVTFQNNEIVNNRTTDQIQ